MNSSVPVTPLLSLPPNVRTTASTTRAMIPLSADFVVVSSSTVRSKVRVLLSSLYAGLLSVTAAPTMPSPRVNDATVVLLAVMIVLFDTDNSPAGRLTPCGRVRVKE